MVSLDSKRAGATSLAICLLLFVSLAGADDKKDKDHGKNPPPSHQSRQVSPQRTNQSQGRDHRSGQSNGSQNQSSPRNYRANDNKNNNRHAAGDSNRVFSKVPGGGSASPEFSKVSKSASFAERDRGRNDLHRGPDQPHSFREAPRTVRQFGDRQVAFDHAGRVRDIHARNMEIHRTVHGERTFVTERHGVRIVSVGGRQGYLQRQYVSRTGRVYVQRTYVVGGVTYARAYRTYYWHGAVFYHYAPAYYYHPVFYAWAYNPWPRPVYYRWGWRSDPWYPAYGYYFAPYPVYPTASLWLTDYLLAENLRLAYEARQNAEVAAAAQQYEQPPQDAYPQGQDDSQQNAGAQSMNTVQLSPEVKQMIADEVQRQLAAEKADASSAAPQAAPAADANAEETPAALDPNHRVFVVATNLDVVADGGQECTLTPGDVILRTSNNPDGSKVSVNVITSKQGDCAGNTNAAVEISDLQEMQNHFREQLDSGMKALADNQGKSGLPSAPDTGTVNGEVPAPTPDANAQNELQQQQKAADGVEGSVNAATRNPGDQQ